MTWSDIHWEWGACLLTTAFVYFFFLVVAPLVVYSLTGDRKQRRK